ncbi:ribose 5-phosphate isomerase B [Bdellovibrio sp. qaytius]|nr:ribose 5-phosphate isomerase B [Bdellovibrio sp. qaytius]
MKHILIAGDHAAIDLKAAIVTQLKADGFTIEDFGPFTTESVDYPDFANKVCEKIKPDDTSNEPDTFGILVCGSGQGMAMRANKFKHIRAALLHSDEIAKLAKEHNNANVICMGSRFTTAEQANKWIKLFMEAKFSEGRHTLRVAKISENPSYC